MVGLNDFVRQWQDTQQDTLEAVRRVGESGWYVLGKEVAQFESELARWWKIDHAVGVGSGLDAIEIGLRVVGCKPGDKVLTTPLSAFATTLAILRVGAVPVFVDCDRYGLIDLAQCEETLRADPGIRFMVPVHLYGHSLNLARLRELRERFELRIVEDCAQSIGAEFEGMRTGTVGQVAATSFYPTKNLGAIGDGGALLSADADLVTHARRLRDYGQCAKYRHDEIGLNSRLDELQAAILKHVHLPRLPLWTKRRREVAGAYRAGINNSRLAVPGSPTGSSSCWHLFPVHVAAAEVKSCFMDHLRRRGIGFGEHYPVPIPDQRALTDVKYEVRGSCEVARGLCATEVSLPIHPYLRDDEVETVIAASNEWSG